MTSKNRPAFAVCDGSTTANPLPFREMTDFARNKSSDNAPLGVATIIGIVLALSLGDAHIKVLGGGGTMGLW